MATTQYKDNAGAIHEFQQEPGDNGGVEKRPVAGMPAAVRAQFSVMEASLVSIDGHVDLLETKLDTLASNQAPPVAGPKFERRSAVGTGLTVQFASQPLARGLTVFNESTTIDLRIAASSGSAHYTIVPPRSYSPFFPVANAN